MKHKCAQSETVTGVFNSEPQRKIKAFRRSYKLQEAVTDWDGNTMMLVAIF